MDNNLTRLSALLTPRAQMHLDLAGRTEEEIEADTVSRALTLYGAVLEAAPGQEITLTRASGEVIRLARL